MKEESLEKTELYSNCIELYSITFPLSDVIEIEYNRSTSEANCEGETSILSYERLLDFIQTAQVIGACVKKIKRA